MTEKCDDYDGYKKGKLEFSYKCGKVIWPAEEVVKQGLHCYDEAHSKAKCITETYKEKIEKEVDKKLDEMQEPLCKDAEEGVLDCIKNENSIAPCFREIDYFKECLEETVREMYAEGCSSNKV